MYRIFDLGRVKNKCDAYQKVLECECKCLLDFERVKGTIQAIVTYEELQRSQSESIHNAIC